MYVGDGVSVGLMVLVGRGVLVGGKGVEAVAHALNKVVKITNPNKTVEAVFSFPILLNQNRYICITKHRS